MAARGGARPGAGRKKGALTKRTQEIVAKASAEGITPLEVMLGAMREAWDNGDKKEAATIAKDAAPFVHPKLAAIEHSGNQDRPVTFEIVTGVPQGKEDPKPNGHAHPH